MTVRIEIIGSADANSLQRILAGNDEAELIAKQMPIKTIPAEYKIQAIKGFAGCYGSGGELPEEYRTEYLRYIRTRRKQLYPHALKHADLLNVMLAEKMISIDDIDELIDTAAKLNNAEISALLLNYKNSAFTAGERARWEERLAAAALTGVLPLVELKKKWKYEKTPDGGVRILGYNGKEKRISVPDMIGKSAVTEIGDHAFSPSGKRLSDELQCSRREIEAVYIPEGVRHIEINAFAGCYALEEIVIAPDNPVYSTADSVMISKAERACVFYPPARRGDAVIPDGTVKIGNRAFYGCANLTGVTIPESVTEIGEHAFHGCSSLKCAAIPEGVTAIKRYTFFNCDALESVELPGSLRSIKGYAFYGCGGLSGVTIPKSVGKIGRYAFRECRSLTKISLPDGLSRIEKNTFEYCSNLVNVTIPESVTEIEEQAFSCCRELRRITIPAGVTKIAESSFVNCMSLADVVLPCGVTEIGAGAFVHCTSLVSITIPEGVTKIGKNAFAHCFGLINVTIPGSVTEIWECAFDRCEGLISVTVPEGVTKIGERAFRDCVSLTNAVIPDSVTEIGEYAFILCHKLKEIIVPQHIKASFENEDELRWKLGIGKEVVIK